jgi:hypothetical protein
LIDDLSILIQNPTAKQFLQNYDMERFKDVKRYMILKEFKQ